MKALEMEADMGFPTVTPIIEHLLEASLEQSQLSQEMAWGLHVTTQELLTFQHLTPAITTLLPEPVQDTQHLLNKLAREKWH